MRSADPSRFRRGAVNCPEAFRSGRSRLQQSEHFRPSPLPRAAQARRRRKHVDLETRQFARKHGQLVIVTVCKTRFEDEISSFHVAKITQSLAKGIEPVLDRLG